MKKPIIIIGFILVGAVVLFALTNFTGEKAVLVITDMNDMSVMAVRNDKPYYNGEIPPPAYKNGYLDLSEIEFAKVYVNEKAEQELVFLSGTCTGSWFLQYVKAPQGIKELWVIPATLQGETSPPIQKVIIE